MKSLASLLCVFAMLLSVSGCGKELKGEKEMKAIIEVKKEASEMKDPSKIGDLFAKAIAAEKAPKDLNLTEEEMKALKEKYKDELAKYEKK